MFGYERLERKAGAIGDVVAIQGGRRQIPLENLAAFVKTDHRRRRTALGFRESPPVAFDEEFDAPQLQPVGRHPRQFAQAFAVNGGEMVIRFGVDDAQGAKRMPADRHKRHARIEAHLRWPGDERVVVEAVVAACVGHDQHGVLKDGMGAERGIAAHVDVAACKPGRGGKEHVIVADHVDRRHRHIKHMRGDTHDDIKAGQRTVTPQSVFSQRSESLGFHRQYRGTLHQWSPRLKAALSTNLGLYMHAFRHETSRS